MKTEKKITNEISTTGQVICPVCNRPGIWQIAKDVRHSSPMVRVTLSNLDALVHNCCLGELFTDINGQIKIVRRRKLIMRFPYACADFFGGLAQLARLIWKRGVQAGVKEFTDARRRFPVLPAARPGKDKR